MVTSLRTVILVYLIRRICASGEAHYECGPHGKFEYCIDDVPGCVVGCHCHPGYYFDTESKICEPNIKLTHDYRRHYFMEPTRVPRVSVEMTQPTPTTTNLIDQKVDAIAKDTDDLGDWLYNQFFKTIENQVINNTDGDIGSKKTRRSGGGSAKSSFKRRARKRSRSSSKKRKSKKKGLKKKLLRITEDDSLFDSSSSSSSDESDSSSESGGSETSSEQESDKDHGHRKILMINKKSTSPLPSFIFLPNIDTPFYPPIGLPPPPIMPMYPMVPVPPMAPMPYVKQVDCDSDKGTKSPSSANSSSSDGSASSSTPPAAPGGETNGATADTLPTTPAGPPPPTTVPDPQRSGLRSSKHGQRNKFMQKLREKMRKRNMHAAVNPLFDSQPNLEAPFMNEPDILEEQRPRTMYEPHMEDVDFKYLSQLIHKMDPNTTSPNVPFNPRQPQISNVPYTMTPMRRSHLEMPTKHHQPYPPFNPRPASKADEVNDSFYSNLGKQIATLIRKVDEEGERQINIEVEKPTQNSPLQTIFNENRYAPRSYWERFVRSPMLKNFKPYLEELERQKHSNENLFNLENEANVVAESTKDLSLRELENIANFANIIARTDPNLRQQNRKRPEPIVSKSKSIQFNLLPMANRRNLLPNPPRQISPLTINVVANDKVIDPGSTVIKPPLEGAEIIRTLNYNILPLHKPDKILEPYKSNRNNSKTFKNHTNTYPDINKFSYLSNLLKAPNHTPLHQQVSRLVNRNVTRVKSLTAHEIVRYPINPVMLNYNSVNYISNNQNNQYHRPEQFVPYQMPSYSNMINKPIRKSMNFKPSYFHHELMHHFDYFD